MSRTGRMSPRRRWVCGHGVVGFPPVRSWVLPVLVGFAVAMSPVESVAVSMPSELCTGDPCIIVDDATIDPGSDLDFGDVDLEITGGAFLSIGEDAALAVREVTLRARAILMRPNARILGGGDGARVRLLAGPGGITLESAGVQRSRIDVQSTFGGGIELTTPGDIVVGGWLDCDGAGAESEGGEANLSAGGTVRITEKVSCGASGLTSLGGAVSIEAVGDVHIDEEIDLKATGSDGGSIDVVSDTGNVFVRARIDSGGGSPDGEGGAIFIEATIGRVEVRGELRGRGATGAEEDCGDGAAVDLFAGDAIHLADKIDVKGGAQCFGGDVTLDAVTDVLMIEDGEIFSRGAGSFGGGGTLVGDAGRGMVLRKIDAGAPGSGGILEFRAAESLLIDDDVDARGTAVDGFGGDVVFESCDLTLASDAKVDARGNLELVGFDVGVVRFSGSGETQILGDVLAQKRIEARYKTVLPVLTGSFDPEPLTFQDLTLPDCPGTPSCGDGVTEGDEVCDDGNTDSCDGCASSCLRPDDVCGDGIPECLEACDDGNTDACDGCAADCGRPDDVCGDGIMECGEACDDGNRDDGDGCSSVCEIEDDDNDDDGVPNDVDNCPDVPNPEQADRNEDGLGDACTRDLAVLKLIGPARTKLTNRKPAPRVRYGVLVQNQSPQNVVIPDLSTLEALVRLDLEARDTGAGCPDLVGDLAPGKLGFPIELKPKKKLRVFFEVVHDGTCVPDPQKSTRKDPGHEDYDLRATLDVTALGPIPDADPTDDVCPRTVASPFRPDPNPDGRLKDKGCLPRTPDLLDIRG